jgi:hypothetical protein
MRERSKDWTFKGLIDCLIFPAAYGLRSGFCGYLDFKVDIGTLLLFFFDFEFHGAIGFSESKITGFAAGYYMAFNERWV